MAERWLSIRRIQSRKEGVVALPESQIPAVDGSFSISSHRLEHGIVIELFGDVDLATAPIAEEELRRAESSEELIVLDLQSVSFMDSTGIRMVIGADQRLRERGGTLRIVRVPHQVHKLFELVGITDRLTIDGSFEPSPPVPDA
jgi:anti-anti-sigma factor